MWAATKVLIQLRPLVEGLGIEGQGKNLDSNRTPVSLPKFAQRAKLWIVSSAEHSTATPNVVMMRLRQRKSADRFDRTCPKTCGMIAFLSV